MEGDRKYRQRGYMDSGAPAFGERERDDRGRDRGPRPPLDITGPRLPRMVESVTAARCYNCSTAFPADMDFSGACPKCGADLHCCKQCSFFESSTRFQCTKPIPARVPYKDRANDCTFFRPRVTVARDSAPPPSGFRGIDRPDAAGPKSAADARLAFDKLFKK